MSDLKQLLIDSKGLPAAFRKNHPIGTTWAGKVTKVIVRQQRDDDGNLKNWDDGNPMQEVVIAIQTDQRDPERVNDDGVRGIYIKWWGEQKKAFREALEAAGAEDIDPGGMFAAQYVGDGAQPANKMFSPPKLMKYEYKAPSPTAGLLNGNGAPGVATVQDATVQAAVNEPWGSATPTEVAAAQSLLTSELGVTPIQASYAATPTPAPAAAPPVAAPVTAPAPAAAPPVAAPVTAPAPAAPAPNAVDPATLLATIKGLIALGMTDEQITTATGANAAALTALRSLPA